MLCQTCSGRRSSRLRRRTDGRPSAAKTVDALGRRRLDIPNGAVRDDLRPLGMMGGDLTVRDSAGMERSHYCDHDKCPSHRVHPASHFRVRRSRSMRDARCSAEGHATKSADWIGGCLRRAQKTWFVFERRDFDVGIFAPVRRGAMKRRRRLPSTVQRRHLCLTILGGWITQSSSGGRPPQQPHRAD